ncbi:MAG: leucine-rich repeat protein [Candidatus Gracilibacteria bacterium]|nr:leucine-rich repeat protein [Candidatus Gracilibacteria bacterium]
MHKQKNAFTLVELIVVITILAILSTIAFISLSGYSQSARNSARTTDVKTIEKALQLYGTRNSIYPQPENAQTITYSGEVVYYQGTFGDSPYKEVGNLSNIPLDPLTKEEYIYSTTANYTQYEILAIYEGEIVNKSILNQAQAAEVYKPKITGTYNKIYVKTNSYYIPLPSLINAEVTSASGVVLDLNTIKSQIVTNGKNLPKVGATVEQVKNELQINFRPHYGTITRNSSEAEKKALAEKLKEAYSGSDLVSQTIYANIVNNSSTEELVSLVDSVVLGQGTYTDYTITNTTTCTDTQTPTDEQYFTFDSSTQTITAYDVAGGIDVVIPCKIGDKYVKKIGQVAFYSKGLTSIVIPSSIEEIEDGDSGNRGGLGNAFGGNLLTTLVLPEGLKKIGDYAFFSNSLTSVTISSSVTSIGAYAFFNNSLTSVTIPNSVTGIGNYAFRYNSLTSVIIPNSVISIGDGAFRTNSLTSVTIPSSVTSIGTYAFGEQTNSVGDGTVYGPASWENTYINNTNSEFDKDKLINYEVQ